MSTSILAAISVELPLYLRSEANCRQNRFVKARRTAEQRGVVRAMLGRASILLATDSSPRPAVTITITRIRKRSARPLDSDNLAISAKAVRDGVADALGLDDGDARLHWVYRQDVGKDYAVRIDLFLADRQ